MSDSEEQEAPPTTISINSITVSLAIPLSTAATRSTAKRGGSTKPPPKPKTEWKKKETTFTFEKTADNYYRFLSKILDIHGYSKLVPVTRSKKFGFKIGVGKKAQTDAVDIDNIEEFKALVDRIISMGKNPALYVYAKLADAKGASKRRETSESGTDGGAHSAGAQSESEEEAAGRSPLERELARLRLLLETKHANPNDRGFTYVANDGERVALTPGMMSEWARAIYDGEATWKIPPNTIAFDPKKRGRSLFSASGSGFRSSQPLDAPHGVSDSPSELLSVVSMLLRDARNFYMGAGGDSGAKRGRAPELSPGDRDAKRRRAESEPASLPSSQPQPEGGQEPAQEPVAAATQRELVTTRRNWIRFEKRYHDGGGSSSFGPAIVPGRNDDPSFDWWFFNKRTESLEKVPDGFVPELADEYREDDEEEET